MELLKKYFELQKQIYEYFGYEEDWVVIPLDDCTSDYWTIKGGDEGDVRRSKTRDGLMDNSKSYTDEIYTQRFLPKWVYRGKDHTMICCDPHTDGNHFLRVFDNSKEIVIEQVPF